MQARCLRVYPPARPPGLLGRRGRRRPGLAIRVCSSVRGVRRALPRWAGASALDPDDQRSSVADPAQDVASNDDDSSSSDEEQAFHVPLDLGEGLLADIRKYLVETEDMDPNDAHLLEAAALEMAAELCRAAEEEEATPEVEQSACHDVEQAARPFQGPADRLRAAPLADSEPGSCLDGGGHVGALSVPDDVSHGALERLTSWEAEAAHESNAHRGNASWVEDRGGLHPSTASALIGIDNWRTGTRACEGATQLVASIEGFWRDAFQGELAAAELDPRWKLLDSAAPNSPGLQWARADPRPGEPGFPRLIVENRVYQTRVFRSLHLELAVRQDGLQIVHCVMWPRRDYALPILGLDAVFNNEKLRFFIADASPVVRRSDASSVAAVDDSDGPPDSSPQSPLEDSVRMLRAQFTGSVTPAPLPEWARTIFSEQAFSARPALALEDDLCIMYGVALARAYLLCAKRAAPLPLSETAQRAAVDAAHRRYCEVQRGNEKTTTVLRKAFERIGDAQAFALADRYMREVLFDHEFHYDVDEDTKLWMRQQNASLGKSAPDVAAGHSVHDAATMASSMMTQEPQVSGHAARSDPQPAHRR